MKALFLIILVIVPQWGWSEESVAVEAGKAFGLGYAKAQAMAFTADFLDKNPNLVFSVDPKIGTKVFTFAAKSLSVLAFVQAKTDKERAWAATSFILSPEPTTAMILLAVQFADAMITIGHMREISEIQRRTYDLARETSVIQRAIAESEINQINFHVNELQSLKNQLLLIIEKIKRSETNYSAALNAGEMKEKQVDEVSIEEILKSIFSFETLAHRVDYLEGNLKILVSGKWYASDAALVQKLNDFSDFIKEIKPIQIHSLNIKNTYISYVSLLEAEAVNREMRGAHAKRVNKTQTQLYCFEMINDNFKIQRRDEIEEIFANCMREQSIQ
ncbi:MAG: hypothetical protein IPL83_20745 [Bdellovibrionales bacterium]|nr:hypothetical protein [Bdellovibrionales bacterium]